MKIPMSASVFFAAGVLVGCSSSPRPASDTTGAAATQPAVAGGPSDSVSNALSAETTATTNGTAAPKKGSGAKGTATHRASSRTGASADTGIIGRDSVIRFPVRGLPTVSSTPIRK
jgi:hypothetical protein